MWCAFQLSRDPVSCSPVLLLQQVAFGEGRGGALRGVARRGAVGWASERVQLVALSGAAGASSLGAWVRRDVLRNGPEEFLSASSERVSSQVQPSPVQLPAGSDPMNFLSFSFKTSPDPS